MSKSEALSQDLAIQILILLPLKSLLRFKCVSGWFCSTIQSQHFVKSRFIRCSGKLIELQVHKSGKEICAFEFNNDFHRELVLLEPRSSRWHHLGYSYCKGLVLLHILRSEVSPLNPSIREFKFSLWNPSTGEYRVLPNFSLECKYDSALSFGLGYDLTTDDYKAVVFTLGGQWDSQVWIFSLRTNHWRRLADFPCVVMQGGNRDSFVDGALYFACFREDEYMIVSFDVAKEMFSEVGKPDCQRAFTDSYIYLNVIGGCLSISFAYDSAEGDGVDQVDTYILKKVGLEFTWTRLYNVTEEQEHFSQQVFRSFSRGKHAYSREGDTVLFAANGKSFSYDYKNNHLQETEVDTNNNHLDLLFCTESLVSLHPYGRLP